MFKLKNLYKIFNILISLTLFLMINSCAYFKLKELEKYDYNKEDIFFLLGKEYKNFANFELYKMYDEIDANYFSKKALLAIKGKKIFLENPDNWDLPSEILPEVTLKYKEANELLKRDDIINNYAKLTAKMISGYDCWLEQLEENWQTNDIARCKAKFYTNFDKISELGKEKTNKKTIKNETNSTQQNNKKVDTNEPENLNVTVFFNYDSFTLTQKEIAKIDQVLQIIYNNEYKSITINGHTDTKGTDSYNLILSKKRAKYVESYLRSKDVKNSIIANGYGEKSTFLNTGDGIVEKKNRRAEIIIK